MNLIGTQYDLQSRSLDIFLAGCKGPHCTNCHNPNSWDFQSGEPLILPTFKAYIFSKVAQFDSLIFNLRVLGGEPLDQQKEKLEDLLTMLSEFPYRLWLFTGYELSDVPDFAKQCCDYIKCGKYNEVDSTETNIQYGVKLATSNQNVYKKHIHY